MDTTGLRTAPSRLVLSALNPADLDSVFAIYGDPATWQHLPTGRHQSPDQSRKLINAAVDSMRESGIGQWAVRVGDTGVDDVLVPGTFLGTGGVNMTQARVWNLGYRLSPKSWGRGFASEISLAAVTAVRSRDTDVPITARMLSNNPASAKVARRAGLERVWEGPSTAGADAGVYGEVFSDRVLTDTALRWLTEHV
jgi:RimJ/RimL family protein N-acetyltransferase